MSTQPRRAAKCSGVAPSVFLMEGSAWLSMSVFIASTLLYLRSKMAFCYQVTVRKIIAGMLWNALEQGT